MSFNYSTVNQILSVILPCCCSVLLWLLTMLMPLLIFHAFCLGIGSIGFRVAKPSLPDLPTTVVQAVALQHRPTWSCWSRWSYQHPTPQPPWTLHGRSMVFDAFWGHCLLHFLMSNLDSVSFLVCDLPHGTHMYPCIHAIHIPPSRGQKTLVCAAARASCKYLDQRQDKVCSNEMLPCRFSYAAQQQRGSSMPCTVLHYIFYHMIYDISYHWFETHHRSVLILSCFGQALPSHCHASFSWSLFSGSTSRPHSSWKLKSRQDDSAPSTLQESNHVGLDKRMRGGATRHWIISYHMNIEHTVLVFACTGQCFKLEGLE